MLYYLCRLSEEYNLNTSYYETLDENFNKALELFQTEFTHSELINLLQNGNIVQKQISALRLDNILSESDADILMSNLVGQDGKIREAVSFRLKEFLQNPACHKFFLKEKNYDIFLAAIIDINGNICRNTISAITNLQIYPQFCSYFCQKLAEMTTALVQKVQEFDFQDGKYKVNKEVFKLYWCLETIYVFTDFIKFDILKKILLEVKNTGDYTIREKAAKILAKIRCDSDLLHARNELKQDRNYYVRRF